MEKHNITGMPLSLAYDTLISLIEHLKSCADIATSRTVNWQKFCQKDDTVLYFLLQAGFHLDEGVSPTLLQLLACALCGAKAATQNSGKQKKEKEKDKEGDEGHKHDEALCNSLVQQLNKYVDSDILSRFVQCFLLESNNTAVRWQAHGLVLHIFKNSSGSQQMILDLMWMLWPELPNYGRKAAQFVDLLGYFTLKTHAEKKFQVNDAVDKAVSVLRMQNEVLANHPNSNIYNMLSGLVEFDGYYLESDPCLVCNNPEVPFQSIKLSAIKVDSRFTANTQIVKLVSTHTISKISLRIGDLKRNKMVRSINFYYNNRTVQSVVELKNKPSMWHKAKKCTLSAGQTELKVEFPLPIVAANLMIEYADFYDNFQASAETLQCPRCSASVPANPGVCGNCGENVFQCHKCRAINYDEKDPFLCNSCGFCKYAKFDYTLTGKPCCAVDPIENEDDRKMAAISINNLLEKADRVYRTLVSQKPHLESLLIKINESGGEKQQEETVSGSVGTSSSSTVNKAIQQLASRYCGDCKSSFDELSKIIQKVLASRKELVEYDRRQREAAGSVVSSPAVSPIPRPSSSVRTMMVPSFDHNKKASSSTSTVHCYGCASSATEHCVTLLRALASNPITRQILIDKGLIKDLVEYNLRRGSAPVRADVRNLLCLLTRDNKQATDQLNAILFARVAVAIRNHQSTHDMAGAVRHEMLLLTDTIQRADSCWEFRMKCVMRLFLMAVKMTSPVVMESVTLPCLKILQHKVKPATPTSKKHKEKTVESLSSVKPTRTDVYVGAAKWLGNKKGFSYEEWKKRAPQKVSESSKKAAAKEIRAKFLMEKYARRWKSKMRRTSAYPIKICGDNWLQSVLFSPSSRSARQVACNIVEALCEVQNRRQQVLDLLTAYLDELHTAGESATEFLCLYQKLIKPTHWKLYLAAKGVLPHIGDLIAKEIDHLTVLEETTLSSDLSQGYALKMLTELLSSFVELDTIKQHYKGKLVGTVLNGYLSLRKLVVQRTKLVDETQDMLLELLEEMTTGTESETRAFMSVCVDTVQRYGVDDFRTPVFIFERLCSIIYPEENDVGEFFMTLEKDPQQEDFLQGRMQGNPYSSNEPRLGPLMRDVKNKICQDCELIALLEDDNGMELLVQNKIISLDLPVKEVYKKIWCQENEGEPMRIVYRMRGLLGDATEDIVDSLDNTKGDEEVDNEAVYKMSSVMAECGGLEVMLQRLAVIKDLVRGKQLLTVLLKLFGFCVRVNVNRKYLIEPGLNTINIMLSTLNMILIACESEQGGGSGVAQLAEQLMEIMEIISQEANQQDTSMLLFGDRAQLVMLLERINSPFVRSNTSVLQGLMRLIPYLTYGARDKMQTLVNYFKPYVDFNKFDEEHTQDEEIHLDCFCVVAAGIVNAELLFLLIYSVDSAAWKDFIAKPSLPFVLKLLTGLCNGHEQTQKLVGDECVPAIHRLEQVSSEEGVGSLAENLMEALKDNPSVAKKIKEVREQTKAEKKRLAMAMRQKQLGALGMSTNEKGQVTAKSASKLLEDLVEESGLTCCICREGYKYQSSKVLGIYTFTKHCNLEDFENKPRKVQGYSTVSHFNIVHYDCHMSAVRHARGREEWESAALQNANTKCNGLLPLWGPQVPESAFASCLARHNTYLQECTGHREPTYYTTVHDIKLLMQRFSTEKSFSDESGGGGRQSNMHLVAYMMHMALYVLNTTRSVPREEKNVSNFLKANKEKWVENCFEVDGPLYFAMLSMLVNGQDKWQTNRLMFLKRLLVMSHVRKAHPGGTTKLTDKVVREFTEYKPELIIYALIDGFYTIVFRNVSMSSNENWSSALAEYIRQNDEALLKGSEKLLSYYEDLKPTESFREFCDIVGLLGDVSNPDTFIAELLNDLP
uniref:E3 ubiquitin-protein ligase UBR4 n=1 Tax=Saccoglossus kowalevskii TaxID=10224 RepID=A0ABM0M1L4_SACKO|nr:PREDICTED: E3 ubiquitin-protein ligase UBR4 [Saccoglossus kowalevskii]